jgi:uncharacterized iron-regulated membrane protein
MTKSKYRRQQAKLLRTFRKIHRITGVTLFFFFFIVAVTALLLGLKKHSGNLLQAKTAQGTSEDLSQWLPLDSLHRNACALLSDSVDARLSTKLDRIDIRKDKGTVKFIFANHYTGLQLDGVTGRLLVIEQRRSDFVENIHDGSILDFYFKTNNGEFKLIYSTIMSLALVLFTITGFWLWYGPRRMREAGKH